MPIQRYLVPLNQVQVIHPKKGNPWSALLLPLAPKSPRNPVFRAKMAIGLQNSRIAANTNPRYRTHRNLIAVVSSCDENWDEFGILKV